MATITVGGNSYPIPEMNFLSVERAWPFIEEATTTLDPMKGPAAGLAVIASAMMEHINFDPKDFEIPPTAVGDEEVHSALTRWLKRNIKASEMAVVKDTMLEVLKEAGLEVTEGELEKVTESLTDQSPSTETAPDLSQSSSPPELKEDPGIESPSTGD